MSRANMEPLRSIAFGAISGTYAAIGTPIDHPARVVVITNNTEGDMIISRDSTIAKGEMFIAAGSFRLFDVQSNLNSNKEDRYVFDQFTQFYVKQVTAPGSGSVYAEIMH